MRTLLVKPWVRNVALVVALLFGFGAWGMMPSKLPVRPARAFELPPANPPASVSIAAIATGDSTARAFFAYRGGMWSDQRKFVMGAILIRHPRGNLLVDAGLGQHVDQHIASMDPITRNMAAQRTGTSVVVQLKAAGIEPSALHAVVLTHAHWDHASGLDDLRRVPVWVDAQEHAFVADGGRPTALVRGFGALSYADLKYPDGPYLGFPQSRDVWGDGSVVIVRAPGHTPGSLIVFVTLANGTRYALLGDLVWQKDGIDLPSERPWPTRLLADWDAHQVRNWILHMNQIARAFPAMVMVPAHDARVWDKLPKL